MKRGNERYAAEDYDVALEAYQAAVEQRPKEAISHYNLGCALYQKKQFDGAANAFRDSLNAKDPTLRAQGYYNLGNAQFRLGDLQGAIRSYKSALRLNPGDRDAKHNLEFALEKLAQQGHQSRHQGSASKTEDNQQQNQSDENQDERASPQSEEFPSRPEQSSTQQREQMSKEDAIRLLEALHDDEKDIQKKLLRKRFARRQRPEKDW